MIRLEAKLSGRVFHLTDTKKFKKLLETDLFMLSPTEYDNRAEKDIKLKPWSLSVARSKYGDYRKGNIRLTLDGEKLNSKYKSIPFSYFSSKSFKNEMEERICSDSPYIKKATSYILRVDIKEDKTSGLPFIVRKLKALKIPVYIFKATDFLQAKPEKAIPLSTYTKEDNVSTYNEREAYRLVKYVDSLRKGEKVKRPFNTDLKNIFYSKGLWASRYKDLLLRYMKRDGYTGNYDGYIPWLEKK